MSWNIPSLITRRPAVMLTSMVVAAGLWLAPAAVSPVAAEEAAGVVASSAITCERCKGCGCKGGPGYRGPNGRCVGHKQLAKICGVPASTNCKAEQVGSAKPVCNTDAGSQTSSRRDAGPDGNDAGPRRKQKPKAGKQA